MKMNIKKVATVLGSALMLGATAGMAAAASYSAPFVSNGAANVAIVVGSNAALSDGLAATAIASDLASDLAAQTATGGASSGSTVSGGDSVKIEGASNKFNLGDQASSVLVTSINADKMPTLLADGVYTDEDNTEYKYTQKINLSSNIKMNHFSDSNYKDKVPTVGINLTSSASVLNYTLDLDTNPAFTAAAMETTTIELMGKEYYVLDVQNGSTLKLTLLDSANSAIITDGESSTVEVAGKPYEVSISFIDSSKVKFVVNGETTNSLASGATYKLSDGTYLGVKDILYNAKDSGVSKAEVSIGKGKLEVINGQNVKLNDDSINEITATITNTTDTPSKLDKIALTWSVDGEAYITKDTSLTMPGFESVKISMADFFAPKSEVTTVKNSGSDVMELRAPIKSGDATIPFLYQSSGVFAGIGKDANNKLVTSSTSSLAFNYASGDRYIVASWASTTEAETYYLKVQIVQEDSVNKTTFTDMLDTSNAKTVSAGNDVSFGNVVLTPSAINYSAKTATITGSSGVSFNSLYTVEGLKVYLPYNSTATNGNVSGNASALGEIFLSSTNSSFAANHNATSFDLTFREEDKDGNLAYASGQFNLTLSRNSDAKVQVASLSGADSNRGMEIGDSEDYESYMVTDLATKIVQKTSADQDWAEVTYAGGQSYADVFVTAPQANVNAGSTSSGATATSLGQITVKDTEASSVSGKNLIVVGGSCINSVAADLLGGAACDAAFTAKTGVKAGEALIKSFDRSGKVALLVAGFNAADTEKAATYLVNKGANTTVGAALKVTSATEATAITA